MREPDAIASDISAAISEWSGGPGPNLAFCGAEPFEHPSLPALVTHAVKEGAQRIRLVSDCSAFSAGADARAVISAGVNQVRFTLLGADALRHDSLLGKGGAFEATTRGVAAYAAGAKESERQVHVSARVPVCRHNVDALPDIVAVAAKAGAYAVHVVVDDVRLDLRKNAPWFEAACDTGIVGSTWVDVEGVPYGMASGWELHLAPLYRQIEGRQSERCHGCALEEFCPGAIAEASDEVLALFRPPPDAEHTRDGVERAQRPPLCYRS